MILNDYRCYVCGKEYADLPEPPEECGNTKPDGIACHSRRFWKLPAAPAVRVVGGTPKFHQRNASDRSDDKSKPKEER